MNPILQIDDEYITAEDFIKFLKLNNEFPDLIEKMIRHKITIRAAAKKGITVGPEELQQSADDFRRCFGLHRAKDTQEWMDGIGIADEDFELFLREQIYQKKLNEMLFNPESLESYFRMNAPQFDTADIQHIVVENEAKAKEIMALLEEEPENGKGESLFATTPFEQFIALYSLDDETKSIGGHIKGVKRGMLPPVVEDKVFNGHEGEIIGPFTLSGIKAFEIIKINAVHKACLNDSVKEKVYEQIYENWIHQRMSEHRICVDDRKLRFN